VSEKGKSGKMSNKDKGSERRARAGKKQRRRFKISPDRT
jgi:hypothetical protein